MYKIKILILSFSKLMSFLHKECCLNNKLGKKVLIECNRLNPFINQLSTLQSNKILMNQSIKWMNHLEELQHKLTWITNQREKNFKQHLTRKNSKWLLLAKSLNFKIKVLWTKAWLTPHIWILCTNNKFLKNNVNYHLLS